MTPTLIEAAALAIAALLFWTVTPAVVLGVLISRWTTWEPNT